MTIDLSIEDIEWGEKRNECTQLIIMWNVSNDCSITISLFPFDIEIAQQ